MPKEITSPASQPLLSPETLQDGPWFENVRKAYLVRAKPAHLSPWVLPLIGFSIAGLLWFIGFTRTAIVGAAIVGVMTALAIFQPVISGKVQRALSIFGTWVGQLLGWVLLAPLFLTVGPLSRVFTRVMGADPLGRRRAKDRSYWHFTVPEDDRTRKTRSQFCVEPRAAGGRNWLGALVLLGVAGLMVSELVFRFYFSFHNPLLYIHDSQCGYRLRPHQDIRSARGGVQVNNYSMRYHRDVTPEKPAGVFRILMLSDSTGFGGEYHTNAQTYAGLMEKRLNDAYDATGKQFEVLPVCVNAWSPHHALAYVRRFGSFGADIALVTIPVGDIDRPFSTLSSTRYMAARPAFAVETVIVMAVHRVKERLAYKRVNADDDAEAGRQLEAGTAAFRDLGLTLKQLGCQDVIYETLPQLTYDQDAIAGTIVKDGLFHRSFNMVRPKIEAAGFTMEYPQTLFKGMETDEIFRDTGHLAAKGHSIYADYLTGQLTARSAAFRRYAGLPEPATPHLPHLPQP